jgi:hypothetical protein
MSGLILVNGELIILGRERGVIADNSDSETGDLIHRNNVSVILTVTSY